MSNDDDPSSHGKSGRKSLLVPLYEKKLEYLLGRNGRMQKWLCEAVSSPTGQRPSPQMLSNWKSAGRIPAEYVRGFCSAFFIDEGILMEANYDVFLSDVDKISVPGSGRYWKALLEEAKESKDGLLLLIEGQVDQRQSWGNVHFEHEPNIVPPRRLYASLDQNIRFAIPEVTLRRHCSNGGGDAVEGSVILCCEDSAGWRTLCPHRHDAGFKPDGDRWILPAAPRRPLKLAPPLGLFRAVAVVLPTPLPVEIQEAFLADRTVWATDAMAAWLFREELTRLVLQREFIVVAGKRLGR